MVDVPESRRTHQTSIFVGPSATAALLDPIPQIDLREDGAALNHDPRIEYTNSVTFSNIITMEMEMDSHGGLEVTIRQTEWKKKLPNNFVAQTSECS